MPCWLAIGFAVHIFELDDFSLLRRRALVGLLVLGFLLVGSLMRLLQLPALVAVFSL